MLQTLMLLFVLSAPAPAQGGVAVFLGAQGATGDVAITAVTGGGPPQFPLELQGIQLLALDFNGRTEVQRFLPGRPQLIADVPGATRLQLPAGQGSLYRYSRAEASGGTTFGLFLIDAAGDARSVFELAGVGLGNLVEPFEPRLAVAPDGAAVLIATVLEAGGDLLEVDLASGQIVNRTASLAPTAFARGSLVLSDQWGLGAGPDRVLRFDRMPTAQVATVALGLTTPTWFSGEIALSANGLHAVTTAGSSPTSAHVWSFSAAGPALRATEIEQHLSGAGFLPETTHGPYLAVSDDGSRVAWATEGATREAWLGEAQVVVATPSTHLTSDALYLDTLDEIGQFMFRAITHTLLFSVGETQGVLTPGIEGMDFYEADLQAGALQLNNLSQSNGLSVAPFFATSLLTPEDIALAPGTEARVFFNDTGSGDGEVLRVSAGQTGVEQLLAGVKSLDRLDLVNGDFMLTVRRSAGNQDREMWHVPAAGGAPVLVLSMPNSDILDRTAVRSDGWFGFVQVTGFKERLWLVEPGTLAVRKLPRRFFYGPTLGFSPTGDLAFTIGTGGISIKAVLPVAGPPRRIGLGTAPGFILPGS